MGKSNIQSILFDDKKWTVEGAKHWLKMHGYRYGKAHQTYEYIRFCQFYPRNGKMHRTLTFSSEDGIKAIIEI